MYRQFEPCGIISEAEIIGLTCARKRHGQQAIDRLVANGPWRPELDEIKDRFGVTLGVLLNGQDEINADEEHCMACGQLLEDCLS